MPLQLVWLVLVLGLVVLAACWFMPREVGKEDEPIVNIRVDLPSIEDMSLKMRDVRLPFRRAAASRRASVTELPASDSGSGAGTAEEPVPSPMGAPQPVLSQDAPAQFALPGSGPN